MTQPDNSDTSAPKEAQLGMSRRRFLNQLAVAAGMTPGLSHLRGEFRAFDQLIATRGDIRPRTLIAADIAYLGAMRLPTSGYPEDEDLTYSYATFAARKVNGVLRFFTTGSNPKGDRVFEFIDTGSYDPDYTRAPRAQMATFWGDVYQGKRLTWDSNGRPLPMQYLFTRGLLWHKDRLYWTYYDGYNTTNRDDWCIGLTNLGENPSQMKAYGPWRPTTPGEGPGVKHADQWLIEMPDGTLGAGASVQSGSLFSSFGPELVAGASFPDETTAAGHGAPNLKFPSVYVQYKAMFGHLNLDGTVRGGQPIWALKRPGNYVFHNVNPSVGSAQLPTEIDPVKYGGVGTFTSIDSVGHCVYINLPDKQAILFFGGLGTGHVWYGPVADCGHGFGNPCGGGQGPNASGFAPRWWIYDPNACQEAVRGRIQPWEVAVAEEFDPTTKIAPFKLGCNKAVGGAYFDAEKRRLYISAYQADDSIAGLAFPLIHVFEIR